MKLLRRVLLALFVVNFCSAATADDLGWASADEQAKAVAFQLTGGDWQEVTVNVPAQGPLGILRLYPLPQNGSVEIDWISVQAGKKAHQSSF
jgi:hypothetical protein